jgi:tetratricopeptide (TPR) repeat protein
VLHDSGRPADAQTELTEAVRLGNELTSAVPQNLDYLTGLVASYRVLALANEACEQYSKAAECWRQISALLERLAEKVPREKGGQFPEWLESMHFQVYNRLGSVAEGQGDYPAALAANRRAAKSAEQLVRNTPNSAQFHLWWGVETTSRARLLILSGQMREALAPAQTATERLGELVRKHPRYEEALSKAARANGVLGVLYLRLGREQQAEASFREQRRILEQMVKGNGTAPGKVELAWMLASCPVASQRDPARAVALAEQVRKSPEGKSPDGRLMLGAAYHRVGRYQEAVELLEPLMKSPLGDSIELSAHLAIAEHHQGHHDKASEHLRRIARWFRSHPHLELHSRFLMAEVNDLLGNPEPSLKLAPLQSVGTSPPGKK